MTCTDLARAVARRACKHVHEEINIAPVDVMPAFLVPAAVSASVAAAITVLLLVSGATECYNAVKSARRAPVLATFFAPPAANGTADPAAWSNAHAPACRGAQRAHHHPRSFSCNFVTAAESSPKWFLLGGCPGIKRILVSLFFSSCPRSNGFYALYDAQAGQGRSASVGADAVRSQTQW